MIRDWVRAAEEALNLPALRGSRSTGNDFDARMFSRVVPQIAAALAQAYGEGRGETSALHEPNMLAQRHLRALASAAAEVLAELFGRSAPAVVLAPYLRAKSDKLQATIDATARVLGMDVAVRTVRDEKLAAFLALYEAIPAIADAMERQDACARLDRLYEDMRPFEKVCGHYLGNDLTTCRLAEGHEGEHSGVGWGA